MPGFNDSHMHLLHFAKRAKKVELSGVRSLAELKDRFREALSRRERGDKGWLEGEGWNQDYFGDEKRFPNRLDLDEVSAEVPIMALRACGHVCVLNSAALEALGINGEKALSFGELVSLFPDGEPDGILKEGMLENVKAHIPAPSPESIKEMLAAAQERALEQGLTSVQSDDIYHMPGSDYRSLFRVMREMEEEGTLRIRISEQCLIEDPELLERFFAEGCREGRSGDKFRVGCIKLLADGSLGARTAALKKPYADDPSTEGLALFSQETLDRLVATAHKNNCPAAIHAIGDRALEMALDAIERAAGTTPDSPRHAIVHCQISGAGQLDRLAELKVQALVQPIFIDYDMNIVESRVGADLAGTSYAWRGMADRGVHISFGTDCPVEPLDTMPNIYAAVTRKNITGDRRAYLPEQKMTMEEAIRAYTAGSAYASGEEREKGTVAAGKLADFIVLDRDLFNLKDDGEILETKVLAAYINGVLEYKRQVEEIKVSG